MRRSSLDPSPAPGRGARGAAPASAAEERLSPEGALAMVAREFAERWGPDCFSNVRASPGKSARCLSRAKDLRWKPRDGFAAASAGRRRKCSGRARNAGQFFWSSSRPSAAEAASLRNRDRFRLSSGAPWLARARRTRRFSWHKQHSAWARRQRTARLPVAVVCSRAANRGRRRCPFATTTSQIRSRAANHDWLRARWFQYTHLLTPREEARAGAGLEVLVAFGAVAVPATLAVAFGREAARARGRGGANPLVPVSPPR